MNINKKFELCEKFFKDFNSKIPINAIYNNYLYTINKIQLLLNEFKRFSKDFSNSFSIILMGSFGRFESSSLSDLDYCIVYENNINSTEKRPNIKELVESKVNKLFDIETRCFSEKSYDQILSNIGGFNDKSIDFTTRILILLESIPLNNNDLYANLVNNLCEIYLEENLRENKYPLFLTNEIIRFWRTLCIDYRWKKVETEKTWGDRNIKLRFSRKLLCFSSILLLMLLNRKDIDVQEFINFVHCPPSIKLMNIYNLVLNNGLTKNDEKVLKIIEEILIGYNEFLESISNAKIRDSLKKLEFESRNLNNNYIKLKEKAKYFHNNLINLIEILDIDIIKKYLIF